MRSCAPVLASHSLAVVSLLPVTTRDPSGLNDADQMSLVWPLRARSSAPVLASNARASPPHLPLTTRAMTPAARSALPAYTPLSRALNDADYTVLVCPLSMRISAPVLASHSRAVLSLLPVTTRAPSALNDADETPPVWPLKARSSAPV